MTEFDEAKGDLLDAHRPNPCRNVASNVNFYDLSYYCHSRVFWVPRESCTNKWKFDSDAIVRGEWSLWVITADETYYGVVFVCWYPKVLVEVPRFNDAQSPMSNLDRLNEIGADPADRVAVLDIFVCVQALVSVTEGADWEQGTIIRLAFNSQHLHSTPRHSLLIFQLGPRCLIIATESPLQCLIVPKLVELFINLKHRFVNCFYFGSVVFDSMVPVANKLQISQVRRYLCFLLILVLRFSFCFELFFCGAGGSYGRRWRFLRGCVQRLFLGRLFISLFLIAIRGFYV